MGTNGNEKQLQINFEPGLTQRFPTAKSVVAFVVYSYGLVRMANAINKSHGELSKLLNGEDRNLDIDLVDQIMEIADSDMLADWFIERRKAKRPDVSKADLARQMEALRRQMDNLASSMSTGA